MFGDRVIGPIFLRERVTAASYSRFLENELQDILDEFTLAELINMHFQQDGHPAHSSRLARDVLNRLFPGRWIGIGGFVEFPPRSPDLTVLDFFIWGYVKSRIFFRSPQTPEQMELAITEAFAEITPEMLSNARKNFMRRVALCLEGDGRHFEHLL